MKYYKISEDKRVKNKVVLRDFPTAENINLSIEDSERIKDTTILYTNEHEYCVFPEMLEAPIAMVSENISKVFRMYEPNIVLKNVIIIDKIHDIQKCYKIPLVERVECFSNQEELLSLENQISNINKFSNKLDKNKVGNSTIFKPADEHKNFIIVSLEIAESILRRGVYGVLFQEIECD